MFRSLMAFSHRSFGQGDPAMMPVWREERSNFSASCSRVKIIGFFEWQIRWMLFTCMATMSTNMVGVPYSEVHFSF